VSVARLARRQHRAIEHVQSGEQSGRSVALVVVGDTVGVAESHGCSDAAPRTKFQTRLHQQFDASRSPVGEEVAMMRMRGAKHLHHAREQAIVRPACPQVRRPAIPHRCRSSQPLAQPGRTLAARRERPTHAHGQGATPDLYADRIDCVSRHCRRCRHRRRQRQGDELWQRRVRATAPSALQPRPRRH